MNRSGQAGNSKEPAFAGLSQMKPDGVRIASRTNQKFRVRIKVVG